MQPNDVCAAYASMPLTVRIEDEGGNTTTHESDMSLQLLSLVSAPARYSWLTQPLSVPVSPANVTGARTLSLKVRDDGGIAHVVWELLSRVTRPPPAHYILRQLFDDNPQKRTKRSNGLSDSCWLSPSTAYKTVKSFTDFL